jgi:uncharacterized protein (DUF2147 family)
MNRHKLAGGVAVAFLGMMTAWSAAAQQMTPKLQNAIGHWQVMNSDGSPGGKVDTCLVNGKLFGKITELRPGRTPNTVCDKCSGEHKNQLVLGMVVVRDFHPDGDDWVDGTVVDPDNGKEYKGKIWAEGNDNLKMRGYIGISLLGRTESWVRIPSAAGLSH